MIKLDDNDNDSHKNQTTVTRYPSGLTIRILATVGLLSFVFGTFNLISIVIISLRSANFSNLHGLILSALLIVGGIILFVGILIINHLISAATPHHESPLDLN